MDDDPLHPSDPAEHAHPGRAMTAADGWVPEIELLGVLERSRAALRSLFHQYALRPEDAEDVMQEALYVVSEAWRWQRLSDPQAYLLGTVRLLILRDLRRRRRERLALAELARRDAVEGGDVPQRRVDSQEDARRLLARLPVGVRLIVALRFGAGLSSREVADQIDRSEASVRQSASRGLRHLRRYAEAAGLRR